METQPKYAFAFFFVVFVWSPKMFPNAGNDIRNIALVTNCVFIL